MHVFSLVLHNSRENENENYGWLHFHLDIVISKIFSASWNNTQFVNIQFCLIALLVISQAVKSWEAGGIYNPWEPQTDIKNSGIGRFEFCWSDDVAENFR